MIEESPGKRYAKRMAGKRLRDLREWAQKAIDRMMCTCPKVCDCQDYEHGLVSNECPEHNLYPLPFLTCPVHGETV